jgi:two-component system LytT family response regulator
MDRETITALIVDDESNARDVLRIHLASIPGVELIGEASNAEQALRMILEMKPDLVFLDVEMPVKSGIDLLADLKILEQRPGIIFQTAFDKYAISAIKHAAFDYLLKPVDFDELISSVTRFKMERHQNQVGVKIEHLISLLERPGKLRFNTRGGFILIDPMDIVYIQADWNYSEVWFNRSKKEVVSVNIGKVEEMMASLPFIRISRSILINRQYIIKFNRTSRQLTLQKNGEVFEFRVSANHLRHLD